MSLTLKGAGDFAISGPPRWNVRSDEFDSLTIPYRGYIANLVAFLGTLRKWSASPIDGRMFLEDSDSDHHQQFPTVDVKFLGCRSGVLPPDINDSGEVVQQARYTSTGGGTTVDVTYIGKGTSKRTVTIVRPAGSIGAITPPDVIGVWYTYASTEGLIIPVGTSINAVIANYFYQRIATTQNTREVVPNQYFENIETKTSLLFSAGA